MLGSAHLLTAASSAAPLAEMAVLDRYESATVLTTATSHVSGLPWSHGKNERPSGRLSSDLMKRAGYLMDGTSAVDSARYVRSFSRC